MSRRARVQIYHPVLDRTSTVSERTLPAWERRGWQLIDPVPVEQFLAEAAEEGRRHADQLTDEIRRLASGSPTEHLRAEAEALGIQVDGRWGAQRLAAEISATSADEPPAPEGASTQTEEV